MYKKKYLLLFIIFTIISLGFTSTPIWKPTAVHAEGLAELQINPGFNGAYKSSQWVPIHVTISNKKSDTLEGILFMDFDGNYNMKGKYYQPVTIAGNTTKQVTLYVPGYGMNPYSSVYLLEHNQEIAREKISGTSYSPNTTFIGVLSNEKDTGNFLATLPRDITGDTVKIIPLTEKDITSSPLSLKLLDALIINNFVIDRLDAQQQDSIITWAKQGGLLMVSGGPQYQKLSSFLSILPVEIKETTQLKLLSSLEQAVNIPIDVNQPITVSNGKVIKGRILLEQNDVPLFVISEMNHGKILYMAYDLAEEPIASWQGNRKLWGNLLNETDLFTNNEKEIEAEPFNDIWSLRNAVQRIPSLKLPSLTTLIAIFAIYILTIGPVIYFVLKKKEKSAWNWFIIPILSIIFTFTIFQIALSNRANHTLIHNVNVLAFNQDGSTEMNSVSALFSANSGDYTIHAKDVDAIFPFNLYGMQNSDMNTWINIQPNQSTINFHDVEFWSFRQAVMQKHGVNVGELTSNIYYQDGKLLGEITNNTSYDLQAVKFFDFQHVQDLGDVAAGETVQVNLPYNPKSTNRNSSLNPRDLLPNHLKTQENNRSREEFMLNQVYNDRYRSQSNLPMLIGWTEKPIIDLTVDNRDYEQYDLTLIKAALQIKPSPDGKVILPSGLIKPVLSNFSTGNFEHKRDEYAFPAGNMEFEFNLQPMDDITVEKVHFIIWTNGTNYYLNKEIYNWKTGEYQAFAEAIPSGTLQTNVEDYLSEKKRLKIRLSHNSSNNVHLQELAISVEGRVNQ